MIVHLLRFSARALAACLLIFCFTNCGQSRALQVAASRNQSDNPSVTPFPTPIVNGNSNVTPTPTPTANPQGGNGVYVPPAGQVPAAPRVTFTANNEAGALSVVDGTAISLAWRLEAAAGPGACQILVDGYPTGWIQTVGAVSIGTPHSSREYALNCNDELGRTAGAILRIEIRPAPVPPTVTLKANGNPGNVTVPYEGTATVEWATTNAVACDISKDGAAVAGHETAKSLSLANLVTNAVYRVICRSEQNLTAEATVEVRVAAPTNHIVFVSSASYRGNLGGLDGADAKCLALAVAANKRPDRPWRAILSSDTVNVRDRIAFVGPVKNVNGTVIKNDSLFQGSLTTAMSLTETGASVGRSEDTWTGSQKNGAASYSETCRSWTSSDDDDEGVVGSSNARNSNWLEDDDHDCDESRRLYCISL